MLTSLSDLRKKRPKIISVDASVNLNITAYALEDVVARKILVVDDEAVLVDTIAYNLEQAGYRVITAADGASALEAARSEAPDLVILDIMLPEMDGLEVCRLLRREKNTETTPILMLTAKTD